MEEIKEKYKRKLFTYDLAFELSLSKYLLRNPLENFIIINEWIYAPHFNEIEERCSNMNKVYKITQNYILFRLSIRENIPKNSLNISDYYYEYMSVVCDSLVRSISKNKDNIDSLIDSKPAAVDLNNILERIVQVYYLQYSSEKI